MFFNNKNLCTHIVTSCADLILKFTIRLEEEDQCREGKDRRGEAAHYYITRKTRHDYHVCHCYQYTVRLGENSIYQTFSHHLQVTTNGSRPGIWPERLLFYMLCHWYITFESWRTPITDLSDIYCKLHLRDDFEIIFVAVKDDPKYLKNFKRKL